MTNTATLNTSNKNTINYAGERTTCERERERKRERETDRQTDIYTHTHTHTHKA